MGFFWWQWARQPVSSQSVKGKIFSIQKGERMVEIAQRLQEKGFIRSALAFRIFVYLRGLTGKIQAGDFRLRPSLTIGEVAKSLTHGSLDVWITFPEGWRREQISQRLAVNLEKFDSGNFLELSKNLEGQLFPDTYLIPKNATSATVLKIFQKNFADKFSSLEKVARKKGLTKKQVLIISSIVEREAKKSQDRSIVAGILIKRWKNRWPLQTDATLQYIKGNKSNWWPRITAADKKLNSPYNTYKYKGLPPEAICNPGLDSMKAVLFPQQTKYWFYLSDKQGNIHYAETVEEHNQNISRYFR